MAQGEVKRINENAASHAGNQVQVLDYYVNSRLASIG